MSLARTPPNHPRNDRQACPGGLLLSAFVHACFSERLGSPLPARDQDPRPVLYLLGPVPYPLRLMSQAPCLVLRALIAPSPDPIVRCRQGQC